MLKKITQFLLAVLLVVVTAAPWVAAAFSGNFTKSQSITITDTSGVARANVPVFLPSINGTGYYVSGFINSAGLNTAMTDNSSGADTTFMMQNGVNSALVIPALPAYGSQSLNLLMGTSVNQTGFPLITGDGGFVTTPDAANIDPSSSNVSVTISGYIDTTAGSGKYLVQKSGAYDVFVSPTVSGNITASIMGGLWLNPDMELNSDWLQGAATTSQSNTQAHGGTYSWRATGTNSWAYQDYTWSNVYRSTNVTITVWVWTASGSAGRIGIYDGVSQTNSAYHSGNSSWQQLTVSKVLDAAATQLRLTLMSDGATTSYFDDVVALPQVLTTISASGVASGETTANLTQAHTLAFNGSSTYAEVPFTDLPDGAEARSYLVWIYPTSNTSIRTMFGNDNSGVGLYTDFMIGRRGNGTLGLEYGNGGYTTGAIIKADEWQRAVVTFSGSGAPIFYLNGAAQSASVVNSPTMNTSYLANARIGLSSQVAYYWSGNLTDMMVYSRALSAAEVLADYNGDVISSGLVSWWKLSEGQGVKVWDSKGGNHSTTVYSPVTWNVGRLILRVGSTQAWTNGIAIPDSTSSLVFGQNNVMPYISHISLLVGGTQQLYYAPDSMVSGSTVSDRSTDATPNDGVITWGSQTAGLSITYGSVINAAGVRTNDASGVTASTAYLSGAVTGLGNESYGLAGFDYGQDATYGLGRTQMQQVSSVSSYFLQVTGLFPSTSYHFRAVMTAGSQTILGDDKTFTTQPFADSSTTISIQSAKVFQDYIQSGDILVVIEAQNFYSGLFPNQKAGEHFKVQLLDVNNSTVLGASPLANWGDRPASIYFNPTAATALTVKSLYYVKMLGNPSDPISGNVSTEYQLAISDWKGTDLTGLDGWSIGTAIRMAAVDGVPVSTYVAYPTNQQAVISNAAGGFFTTGIPAIGQIRPRLFATAQYTPVVTAGAANNAWDKSDADPAGWRAFVGTSLAADIDKFALPLGATGKDFAAGVVMLVMLGCVMFVVGSGGAQALGGAFISIPILWLGTFARAVPIAAIIVVVIIFSAFAIRQFVIKTL